MERLILSKLLEWKNSPCRKPLILKSMRQVHKTWILEELGRRYYENTDYSNFAENEKYKQFFETTKDVDRILQNLMLVSGRRLCRTFSSPYCLRTSIVKCFPYTSTIRLLLWLAVIVW